MSRAPDGTDYAPLDTDTLPARLGHVDAVTSRLGGDTGGWRVREVGDGNLNLVFIVESEAGAVVVKQALPYVRLVGDSWPLPLSRSFYEYHALTRQQARAPGTVPRVFHFDEGQAILVMEFLAPHHILRHSLMRGERHEGLGETLGRFCADTLFRGSDLSMAAPERKADVALFAGNVALCDITESLVFTDPWFEAPMNRHTPGLDETAAALRADVALKIAVQHLKLAFCSRAETLLHGDLHTGSVMVSGSQARVIDPEFALYGPMGFDIGMLIANFAMARCAQPGHASASDDRAGYGEWILEVAAELWRSFETRFRELWHDERTGILYPASLYEAQGHATGAERALDDRLAAIRRDAIGIGGAEIVRRTLGLAHIAEYEEIADEALRARCERAGLLAAREWLLEAARIESLEGALDIVRRHAREAERENPA